MSGGIGLFLQLNVYARSTCRIFLFYVTEVRAKRGCSRERGGVQKTRKEIKKQRSYVFKITRIHMVAENSKTKDKEWSLYLK